MKKRITGFIILISAALLSGCGETIPEISQEQTELITEYAAGLLIKYNSLPDKNLLNEDEMKEQEQIEALAREKEKKKKDAEKAYLEAKEAQEKEKENKQEKKSSDSASKPDAVIDDLAAFYDLNDFSILYSGYQMCQSYPDESRDDYFLAMDATEGKQLCIVKFDVTNTSDAESDFDMFARKGVFYLSIDGADKIPIQSTLLLDDMASYKGMIAPGNTEPVILVFEVDDTISQPGTMELTARYGDKKGTVTLQ